MIIQIEYGHIYLTQHPTQSWSGIQPGNFPLQWLLGYRLPTQFHFPPPCLPFPSHLCSACPRCKKIIPPLQTEAVPHLLPNSLWLLGYHPQQKGHGEDKRVQRYTVCWTLFVPRHEITCQFGLKREPSNIILITLADVKEHHPACFPCWASGWFLRDSVKMSPRRRSKTLLWVCYHGTI